MFANSLTLPWDIGIAALLGATGSIAAAGVLWVRKRQRPLWMKCGVLALSTASLSAFLVVVYGSFIEPQIITVTRATVTLETPEPLRIAVISDLHVGPYKGARFIRRLVSRINQLQPDLVLMVGDLVLSEEVTAHDLSALEPLRNLHPVIGTYAIMGNHDHGIYRTQGVRPPDHSDVVAERISSFGIRVLRNTSADIVSGENVFVIAGIEDALSGDADIVQTFSGIPRDRPTILLSHNPDVIMDPASLQADLIVSGHTHGGQIRLPWIGPLATLPTHIGQTFDQGLFQIGSNTTLAITRGVGESGPRARLFCPPEILLLETVAQ